MAAPKTVLTYPLNGSLKDFAIPFEYLARKFVVVTLIGATRRVLVLNSEYRFTTKKQVTTTTAWGPAQGFESIEIRRVTSATERLVDFSDGSILRAYDLNTAQVQSLHIAEEARDLTADTIAVNNDGDLDARGKKIVNLADGVLPGDAVTFRQQQSWADSALNSSISAGNSASASQTSRLASEAARDVAVTNRNEAIAAKDVTISKRDEASTFASNAGVSASTATAQAGTSIVQAGVATTQAGISTNKAVESAASALAASTYATQVQYGTVPLFSVQWWGGKRSAIPAGHIPADGQAISRALYTDVTANVVAMMGTITDASWVSTPTLRGNWATGDGSATWRVPDLNGKSAGTVGAPFLRGDGTLSAAVAGTIQMDAMQNHTHYRNAQLATEVQITLSGGAYSETGGGSRGVLTPLETGTVAFGKSAVETRPLNVTGCFIIKVFGAVNNSGSIDANQIGTEIGLHNARITALETRPRPRDFAFMAYAAPQVGITANNLYVPFTAPSLNLGGAYSSNTGRFTVQVAGLYRFHFQATRGGATPNQSSPQIGIRKNGSAIVAALAYGVDYSSAAVEYLAELAVGDYIEPYFYAVNNVTVVLYSWGFNGHAL